MKIAILFDHFGPYHLARLSGLSAAATGSEIVGIQLRTESRDYQWHPRENNSRLTTVFTPDEENASVTARAFRVRSFLDQVDPAAIAIAGYARPEMLVALAWARFRARPAVLLSESKADDFARHGLREWVKSVIVRRFGAALVGGSLHASYLRELGFSQDHIFLGYNVVGNDDYTPAKIRVLPSPFSGPYFLAANRFIEKKNLPCLLRAYAAYRDRTIAAALSPWPLAICGDGPLRAGLEHLICSLKLNELVFLPGFLQQAEMLPYFAHAGAFIHASLVEQWGLVVNEAMAAGLPVIVSRACGCFPELVEEGGNGRGFDPTNETELAELMFAASGGDWNLCVMGAKSLERIAHFSPLRFGKELLAAFRCAGLDMPIS